MKLQIKITDVSWVDEDGQEDDSLPTEFDINEDIDEENLPLDDDGELDYWTFCLQWLDYNGSKLGGTADDFDFDLVD